MVAERESTREIQDTFVLRDRQFNLKGGGYVYWFRSEIFFRTTQELEYLFSRN
jgi:hypothetical protein